MQKRRRTSDSVLTGVVPKLEQLRKPSAGPRVGHLSSISTTSAPVPWAVFNLDIFWVLLNSNGQCGGRNGRECLQQCICCNAHPSPHGCQGTPPTCHGCHSRCQDGKAIACRAKDREISNVNGDASRADGERVGRSGNTQAGRESPNEQHKCFNRSRNISRGLQDRFAGKCKPCSPEHEDTSTARSSCASSCHQNLCKNSKADCSDAVEVKDFRRSEDWDLGQRSSLCSTGDRFCGSNISHACCDHNSCQRSSGNYACCEKVRNDCTDISSSYGQSEGCCENSCCPRDALGYFRQPSHVCRNEDGDSQGDCRRVFPDELKERKLSRDSGVECDDGPSEPAREELVVSSTDESKHRYQGQGCNCLCSCSSRLPLMRCPYIDPEQVKVLKEEARQLRAGDVTHREGSQVKGATMRVTGEGFSAHRSAVSEQQQRQTKTPAGTINQESSRQAAKSGLTIKTKGVCTKQSSSMTASQTNVSVTGFDDLDLLNASSQPVDIQNAIMRYSGVMSSFVEQLKNLSMSETLKDAPSLLENIDEMLRKAWSVPVHGHELGFSLCNVLRTNGGMSILLDNCNSDDSDLKFSSAKVLEQCLTTENRGYVVENGLKSIVNVACYCTKNGSSVDKSRVGTGILEHLFKHSEGTCSDIIKMGGLDAVLSECRKSDVETLRHCAGALANLSLYGGSDNQQEMIQRKVPMWLFPLAFHVDENIKYYACLAIATLVANKELEAAVLQSGTLNLVEPFVTNQLPDQFANSTVAHRHGQSQSWLQRLLPVLSSKREEARNLAAFHFCMEAGIKKRQGNLDIFREIGAIEPLKEVASSPNAIASKYAVQALRLIGEEVPHKLSQQVPLWTPEDVREWVKQIGFSQFCDAFIASRVDGDLLLQLTEENLREDIGIRNGILRQRFLRELKKLKNLADYSSCDSTKMNDFLVEMDREFAEYTYRMIRAGVNRDMLRYLSEEQLIHECGILNSIHRQKIRDFIANDGGQLQDANSLDKNLDIFISYRRSNGSQLASLLKVHMQLKDFSVFIDVERLEAGKFDNNLLNSIRQAKNFLLVLTPNALDRCLGDTECKDWVHREIVAALQSGCNIIPILDNFQWPEPEELPEDMRAVCYFNGVRWIHDYQDACVDKIERFMRGECNVKGEGQLGRYVGGSLVGGMATPGTPSTLPRGPPIYQRTTSTESGKGSSCSDKDFAKD
ncbi:NAD(+) hydrolase sarm1-like isoform X8 [Macrobrachium nipponense]|uniref:NAD(+) hydrolase sarm1-like isoform X8 n=1 Tax=Macrobrachium nipponense TaxID=159736 RepID=UPI0030C7AB80